MTSFPKSLDIFYNQLLSNPTNPNAAELVKEAFHEDWNTRPNPLDPTGGGKPGEWPGSSAVPMVLGLWGTQVSGLTFKPIAFFDNGAGKVAVISRATGTCTGETVEGFPHFLGLEPEVLKDKSYACVAIDVHVLVDGKIKQSYHGEDWMDARAQITGAMGRKGATNLEHADELFTKKVGSDLTEVPKCIEIFYDQLLSNCKNPDAEKLAGEAFHADWNTRPNPLDPEGGGKLGENWPGASAIPMVLGLWGTQIEGYTFSRILTLPIGDAVAVVSKMSGTCTGETIEGFPHFLGMEPEALKGKKFESIAIDVHKIVDGKIKGSYHYEDMTDAMAQITSDRGPTLVEHANAL